MHPKAMFRAGGLVAATALIAGGALFASACGDDDSTTTTPASAATTAAATTAASSTAANGVVKLGNLEISNLSARSTTSDVAGVYFTVKNNGAADTLTAVKVDSAVAGMAQVHEMVAEGATMKMQEMKDGLPIPANGTVELKPGGYHVMVMNLKTPLKDGEMVHVDLVFAKAGSVTVNAKVQVLGSAGGTSTAASGMGMGSATPAASATMAH